MSGWRGHDEMNGLRDIDTKRKMEINLLRT